MAPSKPPLCRAAALIQWMVLLGASASGCVIDAERPFDPRVRCSASNCECVDGLASCDGNALNGCETNLLVDPRHCGACGHVCVNSSCQAGACRCHLGYMDCDELPDTVCESDLARDSRNCGDCGRDCRGGACIAGQCQPLPLAEGLRLPRHLAIGGDTAYYSVIPGGTLDEEYGILASRLDAPASPAVLHGEPDGLNNLAFDGERLFWITNSGLRSKTPSPTSTATTLVDEPALLWTIALGASHVYLTLNNNQLVQVLKTGGPLVPLADDVVSIPVVGEHYLYWSNYAGPIWRQTVGGGSTETFDPINFWYAAQLHAGALYWLHREGGSYDLYRKPESVGPRELLASLPVDESLYTLAIVERGIFVSAKDHGTIQHLPLAGGEPTIIARGQVDVGYVAADDEFVYWLTNDALMRLVVLDP